MNFREIDRHLSKCMDEGKTAFRVGKTKYENPYDPGSLSFDAWDSGWKLEAQK